MATAASRCTLSTLLKDFSAAAQPQSPHAGSAMQQQCRQTWWNHPNHIFQSSSSHAWLFSGCVLDISISPPIHTSYRAISTAPPKIQLSPPVPPIPQQKPTLVPDFRHTAMLARCQSRSFLASILNGGHWPSAALNAFTCVHKFRRYFEGVTRGFLQLQRIFSESCEKMWQISSFGSRVKSQSDINSSSFEEVETRPLLLSRGEVRRCHSCR